MYADVLSREKAGEKDVFPSGRARDGGAITKKRSRALKEADQVLCAWRLQIVVELSAPVRHAVADV